MRSLVACLIGFLVLAFFGWIRKVIRSWRTCHDCGKSDWQKNMVVRDIVVLHGVIDYNAYRMNCKDCDQINDFKRAVASD